MKALIKLSNKPNDIKLMDIDLPKISETQVLAKVAYAGICGSDLDILYSKNDIYKPPVAQGHEFSAIVIKIGKNVKNVKIGDYIVSETLFKKCGECSSCLNGDYHLCDKKEIVGWTKNGAFAEYVVLNSNYVHNINHIDLIVGAIVEPAAIATEAVFIKGKLRKGENVVVIGPGTTGILSAWLAKESGAKNVFLVGRNTSVPMRFPVAKKLGINYCINSSETDPIEYIKPFGQIDMIIDCTGNVSGFELSRDLVRKNGRIIEIGSITGKTEIEWSKIARKALDISFVFSSSHEAWKTVIELFKKYDTKNLKYLVTNFFKLDEYETAFKTVDNSKKSVKSVFDLNEERES